MCLIDGLTIIIRHIVKCSPMAIEKYVQRLLQADSRLLGLSIEGSAATGFNQNENQNLEERVCYNVDASPSHTTTNSLGQQIQSSGLGITLMLLC